MGEKNRETDIEIHYKDTFRAFSKDDDGRRIQKLYIWFKELLCRLHSRGGVEVCDEPLTWQGKILISLETVAGLFSYSQVTLREIDEMIKIVDKNGDGRISYSEFR